MGRAVRASEVMDLHLANFAAANDCILATFDAGIVQMLRPSERQLVDIWDCAISRRPVHGITDNAHYVSSRGMHPPHHLDGKHETSSPSFS